MIENQSMMNYTLEEHFKSYSEKYEQVREIYSLWTLLKKDISEKLNNVYRVFPYFSKHDVSHSRTIITNIELFLGEQRIKALSPTDTFMILVCAYSHDIGMVYELNEILDILEDSDGSFYNFLKERSSYDESAKLIKEYYDKTKSNGDLRELYHSIILVLQEYKRPEHWKEVEKIRTEFYSLFIGRIKARFIKSIINICKIHGKNVEEIVELSLYSTGMFADLFHPRFIAAMIRLGDLLDLDNNRFDNEFVKSFNARSDSIPYMSKLHYLKHESITHFFIGPNHIDVEATCIGEEKLNVARELFEWLHWLENDCKYYKSEWDMIAPRDFGVAPRLRTKRILVDGTEYQHFVYNLKMELPHDRIFNLLEGSNVYDSKYAAFREIIQNAIDATLLQLWSDFYNSLSPEQQDCLETDDTLTKAFASKCLSDKFINEYKIHVDVIENISENTVCVEIIDQGIGIDDDDLQYMSRIGANSICNPQKHHLLKIMPDWLVPAGVFGIGLQSAFQLSDEIEFFTKKANRTPRHIRFSSYSSNKGKIEVSKCPNTFEKDFKRLSTQGTMVRIKIKPDIFDEKDKFEYYDLDFDNDTIDAHVIRVEIIHQLNKFFVTNPINYFPITFSNYSIDKNGEKTYSNGREIRNKTRYNRDFYEVLISKKRYIIGNHKTKNKEQNEKIFYKTFKFYSAEKKVFLIIEVPNCKIIDDTKNVVSFRYLNNCFSINYKYNTIIDYKQLFTDNTQQSHSVIELDHSLFKCSITILDKHTESYLNIDRNVLRKDSISYKDIIEITNELFTLVCQDLISETKNNIVLISNNYLPILSVLFARFIKRSQMNSFIKKYRDELSKYQISVNDNQFSLLNLIEDGRHIEIVSNKNNSSRGSSGIIHADFFKAFPEYILVPKEIKYNKTRNNTIYLCVIKNELEPISTIIDDSCWRHDCVLLYSYGKSEFVKTILKPSKKYDRIVVDNYPKTFRKGKSFVCTLDDNISSYILSPFDETSLNYVLEQNKKNKDLEKETIKRYFCQNTQFNKCVNYVEVNKPSVSKEQIIDTYLDMIIEISGILIDS